MKTKQRTEKQIYAEIKKKYLKALSLNTSIITSFIELDNLERTNAREKAKAAKPKSTAKKRPSKSGDAVSKSSGKTTTSKTKK